MKKGFTLLELLIVIGILAILTTIVTVVLNPAQLLAQARDSQRLSDLNSLNSALGLFVASASTTNTFAATTTCTVATSTGPFSTACALNNSTNISGTGWVAVNFLDVPSGSPLSKLPIDPTNSTTYFYGYKSDSSTLTYELDAKLESAKYSPLNGTDGGNKPDFYEIGTDPGLDM
ncbi:type II secretion system protein [Candidatus Wolfebacteria bacterium]|nr:type II secretion system protein [Candidatus Wolfebacteria bacterium]